MQLVPDWKRVLRRAWSLRLMVLAGALTGLEALINVMGADIIPLPAWARALVILVVIAGAFVTRLLAQRGMRDAE